MIVIDALILLLPTILLGGWLIWRHNRPHREPAESVTASTEVPSRQEPIPPGKPAVEIMPSDNLAEGRA